MFYIPSKKMDVNRFVEVLVPTKRQIFARTGQVAVSPSGSYSKDDPVKIGMSPTESADDFVRAAESFELPKDE